MLREIKINDQTISMASNAFTPILYRQIFKKDFLREITSLRKLKGKKTTEMTDSEVNETTDKLSLFTELAFVMAKQAELKQADKLVALTMMNYYEWLEGFEASDFRDPKIMGQIIALWQGNAKDQDVEAKNPESRESVT